MKWVSVIFTLAATAWIAAGCGGSDNGESPNGDAALGRDSSANAGAGGDSGSSNAGSSATRDGGTSSPDGSATGGTGNGDASANTGGTGQGLVDAGGDVIIDGPTFECGTYGEPCSNGAECCSKLCDSATGACTSTLDQCGEVGTPCNAGGDCCSLRCQNDACQGASCLSDGEDCTVDGECCGGTCDQGMCQPLNTECRTSGNTCTADNQCCSGHCLDGKCNLRSSFCIQKGDICSRGEDCCTGRCDIADGARVGTCGEPPSGATNCTGRQVEGGVCNTCGDCCSRLCAPYGPTGVFVCQPASGCHVNGDLCRETSDCCGAAGTGLPGDGNVVCEKAEGASLGICRNPRSCNPQGNVCHFKDYACSGSSSRNNCCAGVGNSGVCQLDALGVPRCNGLGDECRQPGETCASADDCCDDLPCVPDGEGLLRCFTPNDGGTTCVPSDGPCTINADCCPGATCIRPSGSTVGSCHPPSPPPGSGGSGGAGPDGGAGAGGTNSGGAGGTSGNGGSGGSTPCSEYGQQCGRTSDCCNSDVVGCFDGICKLGGG